MEAQPLVSDENDLVIDPVTLCPIPEGCVIVVRELNASWHMDIRSLLEQIVLYSDYLNPLTRNELSADTISSIADYRMTQLISVIVVPPTCNRLSAYGLDTIVIDSFMRVGDLHVRVATILGLPLTEISVSVGDKNVLDGSLDELLSDSELISKHTFVTVQNAYVVGEQYSKLKAFVSDYDRYKYEYSPFPPEHVEELIGSNMVWYGMRQTHGSVSWDLCAERYLPKKDPRYVRKEAMSLFVEIEIVRYIRDGREPQHILLGPTARDCVYAGTKMPKPQIKR